MRGPKTVFPEPLFPETLFLMWYTYILKCANDTLYTGITTDVVRRIKEHNSKKGGKYTRARTPLKLVYKESYPNRSKALMREAEIKSCTRKQKLELINHGKTP